MAKKKNNKMLLILGAAAIGLFMYKKKQDAANEEFVLPKKTAILNRNLKKQAPQKLSLSKAGAFLKERIGNFENIQ